jgi:hypothetical protein
MSVLAHDRHFVGLAVPGLRVVSYVDDEGAVA